MTNFHHGSQVNLDAYCARVGYAGPREPTLAVLQTLQRLHPAAIPFEAIDVQMGRGVGLDPAVIDAKLIGARRGGYCFEQNDLFKRVLRAMSFEASNLLARPRWNRRLDQPVPRTHQAVRVRLDGEDWLADVGFGAAMLTASIRLAVREPQQTAFEAVRLSPDADGLRLEARIVDDWQPIYDIAPEAPLDIDYVAANWFTSTHPDSLFRKTLIVSRTELDTRYMLADNQLTVRRRGAETLRHRLSAADLERSLIEDFLLPFEADWRPVLERAVERGAGAAATETEPHSASFSPASAAKAAKSASQVKSATSASRQPERPARRRAPPCGPRSAERRITDPRAPNNRSPDQGLLALR